MPTRLPNLAILYYLWIRQTAQNCLSFTSIKSKRIFRPVLGAETYAFDDGFDGVYAIWHEIQEMVVHPISLTMLTYSESPFKIIIKSTVITEKRLMIDVKEAREAYITSVIIEVCGIRIQHDVADVLSKM